MAEKKSETTKNVSKVEVTLGERLKVGQMAEGRILRITEGKATDFMSAENVEKRKALPDDPYLEIEIVCEGTVLPAITMKDYTKIGDNGIVPPNSTLGKLSTVCDLAEDCVVPMVAQEVQGRDGKPFVVWNIAGI